MGVRPARAGDRLMSAAPSSVLISDTAPEMPGSDAAHRPSARAVRLGSLAALNARLARPVPIGRFRGNIVVDGAAAWAEDSWRLVRIGGALFRVVKPCDRCIVTTVDQQTGQRPDRTEPLRTLGTFRHDENGIMFGQNLVPTMTGRIAVGDAVDVLESGPPNVMPV